MFKIIIITHGKLASGFMDAAELIVGEQENLEAYSIFGDSNLDEFKSNLLQSIREANQNQTDVLVLSDLMFGTPFNIAMSLTDQCTFQHLTGLNLAILLELLIARKSNALNQMMMDIEEKGKASIYNPAKHFMKEE